MSQAHRDAIDARPDRPAGLVCEAIGAAVSEALATGQFDEHLAAKGWTLVHIGDGQCPDPPAEWLHDALDVTEPGWIDTIGRLEELWQAAWTAGNQVGRGDAKA